jgi:hypothetical protein
MAPDILHEIDEFLRASGMGPTYFGKVAVGNSELVQRLREGRPILTSTAQRVRAFIDARNETAAQL